MKDVKTIFHKNGTVTYWSVRSQCWYKHVMPTYIPDEDIASLPFEDRCRIENILARELKEAEQRQERTMRKLRLERAAPKLLAACQEFVRKVEAGEARSVRSYKQMKEAIAEALGE